MDTRQQHNPTTSTDDWYTPRWLIDTLGPFDLDPCAAPESVRPFPTATMMLTRQDNLLWQEVIFPTAASMIFMRHRVRFIRPDGTTGSPFFGSCLVAWGATCDRRLRQSGIEGKYVVLNV